MENSVSGEVVVNSVAHRLLRAILIMGLGVWTTTRDWTAENLHTNLMIGSIWLVVGFLLAMGLRAAPFYLAISAIVFISFKIIFDVGAAYRDGDWEGVFVLLFCLSFLVVPLLLMLIRSKSRDKETQ